MSTGRFYKIAAAPGGAFVDNRPKGAYLRGFSGGAWTADSRLTGARTGPPANVEIDRGRGAGI